MSHEDSSPVTNHESLTSTSVKRKGIRRGIYLLPSLLTIGNILCGFFAVISSTRGYRLLGNGDENVAHEAALLFDNASRSIGYAVLLDGLDGRLARLTGATSEFGVELDSIADVLSFGIAPALLVYTWGFGTTPGLLERLAWAFSFLFLICGALRLARFNVLARAPRFTTPGKTPKLDKRYFVGLPIPAAAGMLAAIIHFNPLPLNYYFQNQATRFQGSLVSWLIITTVIILAALMVSTFRYTSFKNIGASSNRPFIILPLLSLLIAGIWFYSQWVLLVIGMVYVLHGPLLKIGNLLGRLRHPITSADDSPVSPTSAR